jgi:hypothetical protein
MNALTVNGKQLTLNNMNIHLNYAGEEATFDSSSTLYAGVYEFRVNVPDAVVVRCRNLPEIGEDTVLPIVNGVAKLVLTSDVNIWNASIWPMWPQPEEYKDDPHYVMPVYLNTSNFELVRINFGDILGYDNIAVPSDMDFIYLARTFDGDKIVNTAPNPVLGNYSRIGTLTLNGTGSTAYLSNGNSASNYLYVDLTTAQLNTMKATNSVYTYFIRVMQTTNGLGAIVSFRMLDNNSYIYMIRANYQQLQLHTTTGYDCGTNFSLSTDRVYKVVINGSSLKAYNLDTAAEYSLSYSTTRRMSTRMTSFNGYAGGNDEGTLDRFYALAGIPRATTAEEDAAIKYVLMNQII